MYVCMSNCKWTCLSIYLLHPHRSMFAYTVTAALKSKTVHACTPVFTCYSSKPAANSALHPPPHKISRAPPSVKAIQVYVCTDIYTRKPWLLQLCNIHNIHSCAYKTFFRYEFRHVYNMHAYTYTCAYIPTHAHISFILISAPHTHAYIHSLTLHSVLAKLDIVWLCPWKIHYACMKTCMHSLFIWNAHINTNMCAYMKMSIYMHTDTYK